MYQGFGETGLNDLLARRLTTPGGSSAPSVAPEVFPVLTLESDRPEWGYLKGEFRYARGASTSIPVGQSHWILRNAAGSGIIAVISRLIATPSTGTLQVFMAPAGNFGAGVSQGASPGVDGRTLVISGGVHVRESAVTLHFLDAAAPAFDRQLQIPGAFDVSQPFILTPGTDLAIVCVTATATMTATAFWTERRAQPGELV